MYKLCIFAGTTEGRKLAEFLINQPVDITVCVATEYGETLLPSSDNLTISAKRLSVAEITNLLSAEKFDLVIDATHPYAKAVTESICISCNKTDTEYIRLIRDASNITDDTYFFNNIEESVKFLNDKDGNILLTTGSKELIKFTGIKNFSDRVYARVLPMSDSLKSCEKAGLKPSHIIAMQGPFSEELNTSMLNSTLSQWLVTKDSGKAGGFSEKLSSVQKVGAKLVVIGRPPQLDGLPLKEVLKLLSSKFSLTFKPKVSVIGIGMGNPDTMTKEAVYAIEQADCLIGAKRMLDCSNNNQDVYAAIAPKDIADFISTHKEYHNFAVLMSGDVGFFSGAKKLLPLLNNCNTKVIPGLSSLVYLCAKLKTPYDDIHVTSIHGREHNIIPDIQKHKRTFALLGGENAINKLCSDLIAAGLSNVKLSIGENLSYANEKITQGTALKLVNSHFEKLSVVLIENETPKHIITHGLPDMIFLRGKSAEGIVPMTKSEVRAVCLSKLQLTKYSICWDIGAGTGSVAIEMALQATDGHVYAIEKKDEAIELLKENSTSLFAENLTIIHGTAPKACLDLPAPSHVFIGGSSGNMGDIINLLLKVNPYVRIVATAISLESIAELTNIINTFGFSYTETVSMQAAYDRKIGAYHLMTGQNPIHIFTVENKPEDV